MKIVSFEDIQALNISPSLCYEWVDNMIRHKEEVLLPAKVHMNMAGNIFCNVMPCILGVSESGTKGADGLCGGGVKIVTRYPERIPSLDSKILLFDADTGEFKALMDGNWITAMRTGAVAAHTILNFAKKDFYTIGMVGLGNTSRASMLVLTSVLCDTPLNIKLLRYKNQAELFAERFSDCRNILFSFVDTVEECIRGSDVVLSCATYFEDDIAVDDCFDEGVLVVPVHTRGFTNCDLFFDKVFADDTGHVNHFKNFAKFKYYAEVSNVVNGKSVGRENDKERILVYNIGVSMHDIYFAACIYRLLQQQPERFSMLQEVEMHEPIDKFWV